MFLILVAVVRRVSVVGTSSLLPLFAGDMAVIAPSGCFIQHSLQLFEAKCEAAGMRLSASKSEAIF